MFAINKNFIILGLLLALTGCATMSPNKLGISETQWASYTPEQKKEIIKNYHEVQKKQSNEQQNESDTSSRIAVSIQGGKANDARTTTPMSYQPIHFEIASGQCNKSISVVAIDNPKQKTTFKACYKNNILYLDPSRYEVSKAQGSIQLPYQPVWKRGFTYPNISSSGFANFSNVSITIKVVAGN